MLIVAVVIAVLVLGIAIGVAASKHDNTTTGTTASTTRSTLVTSTVTSTSAPASGSDGSANVVVGPVSTVSASASASSSPGIDSVGNPTTFEPGNAIDGRNDTAWRVDGDGTGASITIALGRDADLTSVWIVPGYDKVDPYDGTDRFFEERRVSLVQISGGGSTITCPLDPNQRARQRCSFVANTSTVTVTILGVTSDGGRDFTPISEIAMEGSAPPWEAPE